MGNTAKHHKSLILCFIFLTSSGSIIGDTRRSQLLAGERLKIDFNDVVSESGHDDNDTKNPLRIAVAAMISPSTTYKHYVELLKLVGKELGRSVDFIQRKTYSEVNMMMKQKKIDIAFVCSGPYVLGKRDFGMEIVAVPVCNGEKVYYSYFIASKKSGIKTFDCFRGKTFAFTDPLSNTGYMVPVYYVGKKGYSTDTFFKSTFFSNSHDNSIRAVAKGIADGAAVDSLIYEFIAAKDPASVSNTIIVEKSAPYGMPPVVVHPSMKDNLKRKIRSLFLSIHKKSEGRAVLNELRIDRFVAGNDGDYESVRDLLKYTSRKPVK